MRALSWTDQATADLAAIHAFISQESPHYATVVVRQLIAAVDQQQAIAQHALVQIKGNRVELRQALGGRRHQVITALAVRRGDRLLLRESLSTVKMKRLSDDELNAYIASSEWQGKAGGYGIQGLAGAFIPWISGSFTGIMGLPVAETAALLTAIGYPVWRRG